MKMKKYPKAGMGIATVGIGLGAGSAALGSVGGTAATQAQTGIGKMSGAMPKVGGIVAAGMVMDAVGGLKKQSDKMYKKKKKKY